MQSFAHTVKTWLLAQLMHPILFLVGGAIWEGGDFSIGDAGFFLFFLLLAMLLSLPALIVSALLLYGIVRWNQPGSHLFFFWILVTQLTLLINVACIFICVDREWPPAEAWLLASPAAVAALSAVLIRRNAFYQLVSDYQIKNHEDNLV